jgi:hypothetical protein
MLLQKLSYTDLHNLDFRFSMLVELLLDFY